MRSETSIWVSSILASGQRRAIPILASPGALLAGLAPGRVYRSGAWQYACLEALAKRFPADVMVTFMDLSLEAEAFGCGIAFSDHEIPTVSGAVASDGAAIDRLRVPEVGEGRTGEALDCARRSAAGLGRPVFGGMIGPFSLAGRLADMTEIMVLAASEPELAHALLDKAAAFLTVYAQAIQATGVAGLVIAEPAAGLLSPAMCKAFATPYLQRIIAPLKRPGFTVVLHNCGNTRDQVSQLLAAGPDALHVGNAVDILDIQRQVPPDVPVMGNVDPVGVLAHASPETVYAATSDLLRRTSAYPNFALSTGCDVPAATPAANLDAFFNACRDYNHNPTRAAR